MNALTQARGLILTETEEDWFVNYLHQVRFTLSQAVKAEIWILRGDWRFRSAPQRLFLSDFYPSEENLAEILKNENLILVNKGQESILRRFYNGELVSTSSIDKNATTSKETGKLDTATATLIEQTAKIFKMGQKIERLEQEAKDLRIENERLQRLGGKQTVIVVGEGKMHEPI